VGGASARRARRGALLTLTLLLSAAILAACGGNSPEPAPSGGASADTGVEITMWTRAATQTQSQRLVDAYNQSHKNQVKLTVIETDNYQPRIAAAAGARQLPDVFAADVIFVPNYTSQGLFLDITDRVNALPFKDSLAPSHMKLGTFEDKLYTVPHTLDLSVLFYNKGLYKQAGLDPEKPPTTLKEMATHARTIREKVGGKVYGTFFGGNCGGCFVFTFWPSVWAAGGQVMNPEGTQSTINDPNMAAVFEIYRGLVNDGITGPTVKTEQGPTWTGFFPEGTIGVMPMPSTTLGLMPDTVDVGVAPIPGPDGGESTFVGGDSLGISSTTQNADAAWDFVSWTLSDEAQVEILAKNKDVVARTDLANNKYSAADPRVVLINEMVGKGQTPFALRFGPTYNDPQGPWLQVARNAVFGTDVNKALTDGVESLTKSLAS
jgi:multiple sugar transport system substrate-binding protein